jgi:hypothetical protein
LSNEASAIRDHLRLHCYILYRDYCGLGWWATVNNEIRRKSAGRRAKSETTKQINDLLHCITSGRKETSASLLGNNALTDIANQLAYAHKHDVPFQFLLGFLAHVGFDNAAERERHGLFESWHPQSATVNQPSI